MSKKVVFFDIDGTLIGGEKKIQQPTEKTREIIKKMKELGHTPVLATGRPLCMVPPYIRDLGFDSLITSAGSSVRVHGEVVSDVFIPSDVVHEFIKVAIEKKISFFIENSEKCYTHPACGEEIKAFLCSGVSLPEERFAIESNYENININKLFVKWNKESEIKEFMEIFKENFIFAVHLANEEEGSADVMYNNVTKASGVEKIISHLNIPREDSYAVGDGENDLEMFGVVGNGIAMGNGVDALKAIATVVTESVDNDGIYEYFSKQDWMK